MKILSVIESNPVGQAHDVLDAFIAELKQRWDVEKEKIKAQATTWWKFWETNKVTATMAISFILNCLDELIQHIDEFKEIASKDKKATVLRACRILYDYVVREALPIWLKPFAGRIEALIIDVMISYAIDWIVEKYRNGIWKAKNGETEAETPKENPEK